MEEEEGFDGVSILVASCAQDIAQEAKELMVERAESMPSTATKTGALLTASVMIMDSVLEAGLNSGRKNAEHPMVMATLRMFDTILAPKLAELRRIQEQA